VTFNRRIWAPIALLLAVGNLVAAGFAAREAEPWHAALHAALALLFGLWAQRLGAQWRELPAAQSEASEAALADLQRRVSELEERVDFAERLLSRQRDLERLNPPDR
jgi:hypothetical protein